MVLETLTLARVTLATTLDRSSSSSSDYKVTREAVAHVFRENHARLSDRFGGANASDLCQQLFSKSLLSVPVYKMVLESPRHITQAFLECGNAIYDDPSKLNDFLNILEGEKIFVPIAETLRDGEEGFK